MTIAILGVDFRRKAGIHFRLAREDLGVSQEESADLAGIYRATQVREQGA